MSEKLVSRFRRWYWSRAQPARRRNPLDRVILETRPLPVPSERMTARQALDMAAPIAAELEAAARLTLVVSDGYVDAEGRSRTWEFFYHLPERRATAAIEILGPIEDEEEDELDEDQTSPDEADRIEIRVVPFVQSGDILDRQLREGRVSPRFIDDLWDAELRRRPPLPIPFRDSPEAVRAMVPPGVVWIYGSTLLNLRGHVLDDGSAVWEADGRNDLWRTPFA